MPGMQPAAFAMQGTPHHDMDLHMTESGKVKEVVAVAFAS